MNGRCIAVLALVLLLASCDTITGLFRSASLEVAEDLPSERFEVAELGTIHFAATLRQEGIVAAEGRGSWALEPDVEWELEVERAIYPSGAPPGHPPMNLRTPNPDCYWFWCPRSGDGNSKRNFSTTRTRRSGSRSGESIPTSAWMSANWPAASQARRGFRGGRIVVDGRTQARPMRWTRLDLSDSLRWKLQPLPYLLDRSDCCPLG